MIIEEQLISIFQRLQSTMDNQQKSTELQTTLLQKIVNRNIESDKTQVTILMNTLVISANTSYTSDGINNHGFNRCRLFLYAGFTPAHSGGILVKMLHQNSPIGEVLKIISSNGSCGGASLPIDISQLSGFNFELVNQDKSQSTTIKNLKVVLYNDKSTSYILDDSL